MKIEKNTANNGFDLSDLPFEAGRPIHLCALGLRASKNTTLCSPLVKNIACVSKNSVNIDMPSQFKYTAIFQDINIRASVDSEVDPYLAKASVENLRPFLPQGANTDLTKDLLGVVFDAFVVNRANKNGHIIGTDVALSMVSGFISKYINIEHNRKTVVGFITGYGFSKFGTSEPLTLEQVRGSKEPFNVFLQGLVWKVVNEELIEALTESSDPSSSNYLSVSASWELGFNEFNIAEGNKNLNEATIIDNEEEILRHKDDLKVFGGSGISTISGKQVFLNLQGAILPLGIGFTNNPAAEVKGVVITHDEEDLNKNEKQDNEINKKSVSSEIKDVKKTMQINQIEDITEDAMKEVSASAVREFISNKITELAKDWTAKAEEKENALKVAQEELASLKTDLEAIKADGEKVKADFAEVQENIRKQEIEATFQRRMSLIDDEFNLTDADRTIVAEDLQIIADEESFDKWYNKFATLAEAKKKVAKKDGPKTGMEKEQVVDDNGMSGGTSFSSKKKEDEVDADDEMAAKKTVKKDEEEDVKDDEKKEDESKASIPSPAGVDLKNDDHSHTVLKTNDPNRKGEVAIKASKTIQQVVDSAQIEAALIPNAAAPNDLSLMEKISAAFNKSSVRIKR